MNVNNISKLNNITSIYYNSFVNNKESEEKIQNKDKIEISEKAKELSSVFTLDIDDKTAKKIQELKDQIESGNYKVDSRKLAEKMINF